jgi:hypothetical protein
MPSINYNLDDSYVNISRPTVLDITRALQESGKLDANVKLLFPSEFGFINQNTDTGEAASVGEKKIFIEYTEDYQVEAISSTAINRREHPMIFSDTATRTFITPIYTTTNLSITYRLKSTSKVDAFRWYERMRVSVSAMQEMNIHSIQYHYTIPKDILTFLDMIYRYREATEPYNQSKVEYYLSCFSNRITALSDTKGTNSKLAIQEIQSRIVGQYEFMPLPDKPEKDNETGLWSVGFIYRLTYEKPTALNVEFPVMVHNRLLPESLNSLNARPHRCYYSSLTQYVLTNFENEQYVNKYLDRNSVFRLPVGDYYSPVSRKPDTTPFFYCLVELEQDKRTLVNLRDLGEMYIDEIVLTYIRNHRQDVLKIHGAIFQVTVYKNENPINSLDLVIDDDLTIRSTRDLSFRDIHRVELSVTSDLATMSNDILNELKDNIALLIALLLLMYELSTSSAKDKSIALLDYRYLAELFARRLKIDIGDYFKRYMVTMGYVDEAIANGTTLTELNGVMISSSVTSGTGGVGTNPMYMSTITPTIYDRYNNVTSNPYSNAKIDSDGYYYDIHHNKKHILTEIINQYIGRLRFQSDNEHIVAVTSVLALRRNSEEYPSGGREI